MGTEVPLASAPVLPGPAAANNGEAGGSDMNRLDQAAEAPRQHARPDGADGATATTEVRLTIVLPALAGSQEVETLVKEESGEGRLLLHEVDLVAGQRHLSGLGWHPDRGERLLEDCQHLTDRDLRGGRQSAGRRAWWRALDRGVRAG